MKAACALLVPALLACLSPAGVHGHGYMNIPTGRTTDTINDMDNTGVCDSSQPGTVTEFESGENIQVQWSRNNHIGGFIRFAIAPKDDATKETFDASAFAYVCREVDCDLKECGDNDYCGDDAGTVANEIKCGTNITLPDYLEAGDYVLQWTWFAAGSSYGHIGWTTGNYRTCADIKLTTSGSGSKPSCPSFAGGDRVTAIEGKSSDQCFYFDTNDLVTEEVQYDDDTGYTWYLFGIPAEIERCSGGSSASSSSVSVPSGASSAGEDVEGESGGEDEWSASGNEEGGDNSSEWSAGGNEEGGDNSSEWSAGGNEEGGDNSSEWSESNGEGSTDEWGGASETGNEGDDGEASAGSVGDEAEETPAPTPSASATGCRARTTRH